MLAVQEEITTTTEAEPTVPGVVRLHVNNWLEIHRIGGTYIPPEALERTYIPPMHCCCCWKVRRNCSPAMVRLITTCSAVKNLQQLAQDADLALFQIFQIAAHLAYWGKAIIIDPLCENKESMPVSALLYMSIFVWF
ncbi:GATOR complex protein NPRL3-like [Anoplopoma fimbria]|uniref:GATOR complex protein NPRL3-like n=1 Tax=Anoplopoma fimbria TaxID=229290 RepID=UPI0023EC13E8|nr:GATOR complex protein NPRL3-like [Anoplopoma fimbria]